jgi:hypothetical protein
VELEAVPHRNDPGRIGFSYSLHDGYESNVQIVPAGTALIIQNFRLRRVRAISAGESVSLSIDPDSSRCHDSDLLFVWESRCESIEITTNSAGTLVIEARAPGSTNPEFHYWGGRGGRFTGPPVPSGPGTLALPVVAGTYHVMIGIPDGLAPQRFDVVTSMR